MRRKARLFLLTTSHGKNEVWDSLPVEVQEQLIAKKMKFYIIDAISLAEELGLGSRINMIMQTAFFVISGIIPKQDAIRSIKEQIRKTYVKKGIGSRRDELRRGRQGAPEYCRSVCSGQGNKQGPDDAAGTG